MRGQRVVGMVGAVLAAGCASAAPTVTLAPSAGGAWHHDGSRVAADGWRIEVATDAWGEAAFLGPILAFTEIPGGFVFVDGLGVVARSATFTGPLERVGELADEVVGARGEGRLTVRDASGRVWHTAGGPLAEVVVRGSGSVLEALFVDADTGAALTTGGFVWTTTDGGATWTPIELPDAARSLYRQADGIAALLVHAERQVVVARLQPSLPDLADDAVARLAFGLGARDPWLAIDAIRAPDGTPLGHGRDVEGSFAARLLPGGGHERLGTITTDACSALRSWGSRVVALCELPEGEREAFASDDGTTWGSLVRLSATAQLHLSDDGKTAVIAGTCDEEFARADLCATTDGGRTWSTVTTDVRVVEDLGGGRVLGRAELERADAIGSGTPVASWRVVDLAAGTSTPLAVAGVPADTVVRSGRWIGEALALELSSGEAVWLATGAPDALAPRLAPPGATRVAASRPDLAVASGDDASGLWWSRDQGKRWKPLRPHLDGDLAAVPIDDLLCVDAGCRAGPHVVVGSPVRVDALARTSSVRPAREWPEDPLPVGAPVLTCAVGEPVVSVLPEPAPGVDRRLPGGGGGRVAVDLVPGTEEVPATVRWVDAEGVLHTAGQWTPRARSIEALGVRAVTPKGVLLTVSRELWWAVEGQPVVRAPKLPATWAGVWVAAPDGALWVTVGQRASGGTSAQEATVTAVHLPVDGTEPRSVQRVVDRARTPFLPVVGWLGGPVVARPVGEEVWPFDLVDLEGRQVSLLGSPAPVRACLEELSVHRVYLPGELTLQEPGAPPIVLRGWLGLEPWGDEACVREVRVDTDDHRAWRLVATASGRGSLTGVDAEGREVTCELGSP